MTATATKTRGRAVQVVILLVVAVVSWALAFYFRIVPPVTADPDKTAEPGATQSVDSTSTQSEASATPAASSASTASSAQPSTPPVQVDPSAVAACVKPLFPKDTFRREPSFALICENPYPRQGITHMQQQVVAGRGGVGGVSPGMRMWADLGWYQVAAFAVIRGHCCPSAVPLVWTMDLPCPIDKAIEQLEQAARAHDDQALNKAIENFTTNARCLSKVGLGVQFGQRGYPGPGLAPFRKMLERRTATGEGG